MEFWVGDLKGVGDWAMFEGLATRFIQGPTDDHVIQVTKMLEDAVEEMNRRLMAPPGTQFPALIVNVDEAQVAFMCPLKDKKGRFYGGSKATSRYFMAARKLHNQGRAVNVLLWQGTQDPTDQNLPKLVREGAHTRASLALGTESQSRMALGDKAVNGGAAPTCCAPGSTREPWSSPPTASRSLPDSRPSRSARTTSAPKKPMPSPTAPVPRPCGTASPP